MQAARGASLTPSDQVTRPPRRRALRLFAAVALTAYLLDLLTKVWAVEALSDRAPVPVVGTLFQLELVRNPGAAFSTGTGYTAVLSCIAIAAVAVVLWSARRLASPLWAVGLGALLGGVLGNLTDRVFRSPGVLRGHVVDFFHLQHWPVFNVADVCINLAAVVIVVQALRGVSLSGRRPAREEQPDAGAADGRADGGPAA